MKNVYDVPVQESVENRFTTMVRPAEVRRAMGLNPLELLQPRIEGLMTPERSVLSYLQALEKPDCPNVLLTGAHTGEYAFMTLMDRLTEDGKKNAAKVDAGTFYILQSENIPGVCTAISRLGAGFDANRRLPSIQGKAAKYGSFVWTSTTYQTPMFQEGAAPTEEEMLELAKFHDAYFAKVRLVADVLIARKKDPGERILAIDVHSFPDPSEPSQEIQDIYNNMFKPVVAPGTVEEMLGKGWLFVLSDRIGMSCDDDIKYAFAEALMRNFHALLQEEQDLLNENNHSNEPVVVEKFMVGGGYNVEYWAAQRAADRTINGLQMEINEAAYVDFIDGYDNANYNRQKMALVKRVFEQSVKDVDALLKDK